MDAYERSVVVKSDAPSFQLPPYPVNRRLFVPTAALSFQPTPYPVNRRLILPTADPKPWRRAAVRGCVRVQRGAQVRRGSVPRAVVRPGESECERERERVCVRERVR